MIKINTFKNCKTPYVLDTISVFRVLQAIKEGNEHLPTIQALRAMGKSNPLFESNKLTLPTCRFNFLFKGKATNATIIEPTGLLYVDVDACDTIDNTNPLIWASWRSVSNTGWGILVKVSGLTLDNYKDTYNQISIELGLSTDVGARKATQQTVLSYDTDMYTNKDSITFQAINIKSDFSLYTGKKEKEKKELILPKVTFLETGKIRYNNVSDYFTDNDKDYIVFDELEDLCIPFIPRKIHNGERNKTMYFVLTQYALLNPNYGQGFLTKCAVAINDRFLSPYDEAKIQSIVGAVITQRENGTLQPYFNKKRRIIFNTNNNSLTKKEKQQISAKEVGRLKTDKTRRTIYQVVEGWDFTNGKITQQAVATAINKNIRTVKRNWEDVKDLVKSLNNDNKDGVVYTNDIQNPIPTPVSLGITTQEPKAGQQIDLLDSIAECEAEANTNVLNNDIIKVDEEPIEDIKVSNIEAIEVIEPFVFLTVAEFNRITNNQASKSPILELIVKTINEGTNTLPRAIKGFGIKPETCLL